MWESPRATLWVGFGAIALSSMLMACSDISRVTIEPEEISLREAGETAMLQVIGYNKQGKRASGYVLRYQSQAPEIASVSDSGVVTAVGHGTTNIVVIVENSSIMEFVPVSVRLPEKIDIRPGSATCHIGESRLLKATLYDRGGRAYDGTQFEWTSSNTKIATVERNGEVIGLGEGDVIITAKAQGLEGRSNISVSWSLKRLAEIAAEKRGGGGGGGGGGRGKKSSGNGFSDPRLGIFDD